MVKYFGSVIQELDVNEHGKIDPHETVIINELISKYTSETLIKLDLYPIDPKTFESFAVPF